MSRLLLIGNSVNRLDGGPAWADVLAELPSPAGATNAATTAGKPLPLLYEHIVSKCDIGEGVLKTKLANSMAGLSPNAAHKRALDLASPHLLTTNYDYCLERTAGTPHSRGHLKGERTYSAYRRTRVANRFVWHIHGELNAPRTLLLGLHQYAGYLQKLRAYLTADSKPSPFMAGALDFDKPGRPFSWVDLFLRDDVHIAGLTMDYVELHLWWLITFKLRLSTKRSRQCGATHFYHFQTAQDGPDVALRLAMLRDLNVTVHDIGVGDDWKAAHSKMFDRIEAA